MSQSISQGSPAPLFHLDSTSSLSCKVTDSVHDETGLQPFTTRDRALSCELVSPLPDSAPSLGQTAIAALVQAHTALHQWRQAIESQGVLYGEIHTYPHHGKTRYNFYPDTPDRLGKKRRTYVSEDHLAQYRIEIARGRQSKAICQLESDLISLMQNAKRLA